MGTPINTESWNLFTNSSGFSTDGSTETSPAAAPATLSPQGPTVVPASSLPLNYYVRFTLLDGSVFTVNAGQFFALGGFSFGDQQTGSIGSASGGAGAGKVTFTPLQLTLSQLGLQPALFEALASGAAFQEVDVLGYSQSANQLVTDDSFGVVFADSLSTDASGATQVGLEYGSEEIQQFVPLPDGSLSTTPVTGSWNRSTNSSGFSTDGSTEASPAAAPATLSPQGTVAPASSLPLNYYVRFTLSDGDVVTVNEGQFFALEGFSYGDQSQSSFAGVGKATFGPLQLTFSQLGLQPALFEALAAGSPFEEVDVLGYSQGANQLVTDDSFGLVIAGNLSTDASGATQVSLKYGSQEIQQSVPLANGSLSAPVTDSWNLITNTSGFSTDGSTEASPAAAPATLSPQPVASLPLNYYVRFTLSDGSVVTVNEGQLFPLEGFSFGVQQSVSGQSSGAGAGKTTFDPLQLTITALGLQPVLFEALATGSHFNEVDVLGYSHSQGANQLVTDDSFGLVLAGNLSTDASGATQLSLEYGSQEIQQSVPLANGSLSAPVIDSWNLFTNASGFTTNGRTETSPLAAPNDPILEGPGAAALDYYVRFTLSDGSVFTVNEGQFFALEGFSFGDQQSVSIGSASGGAGAGKATFAPLQLTFSQLGLPPALFEALASGSRFEEVDVLGYSQSANQLVTDDSFGFVFADGLSTDASGATQVSLEYGSQEIQQSVPLANGSLSAPVIDSWNLFTNASGFTTNGETETPPAEAPPVLSPQGSTVAPASSLPLNYYVRFTLSDGSVVTVNEGQFFALEGFSFGDQQSVSIGSASSGQGDVGKATFAPLQLTFSQLGLQPALFQALASGSPLEEVDVLGYSQDANQLVTDDSFGLVFADNLSTDAPGATQVSLEYGSQEIQQSVPLANGSLSAPVTDSWNLITNASGFSTNGSTGSRPAAAPTTLSPQDSTVAPAASLPLNYYVRFTLSDGDVVSVNEGQLFALEGFSFGDQQTVSIGSASGGAGVGKATFNPLQLTFSQLGLQPVLFQALAAGSHFKEVDVLGYSQGSNQLVTDDSFGLVIAGNLSADASGATQVSLEYGSQEISVFEPGPTITSVTPAVVEMGQSTEIGTVAPGLAGDTLALQQTSGSGTLALQPVGGVEEVFYTAPAAITASALDAVTYTVTDQQNDAVASGSATVQLDAGPTITSVTPAVVEKGQSTEIGTVAPGLVGDKLTLTKTSGDGALSLQLVGGVEEVIYTAPAAVAASALDAVAYTVNDQHNDAVATGSSSVQLDAGPAITSVTPAVVEMGQSTEIGTVAPGLVGDMLTLTKTSGDGALSLQLVGGVEEVIYTAPAAVAASALDAVAYTVNDQHNDAVATGSSSVQLDAGPAITSVTPAVVEMGQSTEIGTVAPGLVGDMLTLTKTSGSGTLALQLVGGVEEVFYTAPATVAASALDAVTYTVNDQHNDAVATGSSSVQLDAGPAITSVTPAVVEMGQSTEIGTVAPGLAGDMLTLTKTSGSGTLALQLVGGVEEVFYTAPATVAASALDAVAYTVTDQHNDAVASGSATVQLDAGPTITSVTPAVVEKGQSTEIGTVAPGLVGDMLTLTKTSGSGTLALQLVGGVEEVFYTAPATVAASALDAVAYTVTDQHNDAVASGSATVQLDAGPTITSVTPAVVEMGQSTEIGTVAPGLAGDKLTLTKTSGSGTLALQLVGGVEEVFYTAPATVAASALDAVAYTVTDQHNDAVASGSATVQLDAGPTITSVTPAVVEKGQSTEIGTVAPGLVGDMLTLTKTSGDGALSLQLVGGVEEVFYTAPATVAASALDAVTYTVNDQHNDAVATGSSTVPLASGNGAIVVGTAGGAVNVGNGNSAIDGRAGNETINAGNGADAVFAGTNDQITLGNGSDTIFGGSNDTIQTGNGIDAIFAAAHATITGGNGNDSVSAGPYANITLGNGNDTITVGDNSTLKVGNGNDTMTLGTSDAVTVGTGQDTFIYSELGGNNSIAGFLAGKDSLDFSQINPHLNVPNAPLSGNMVAPDSLAWVYQGNTAMIYINDTTNTLVSSSLLLTEVTLTGVSSGLSAHNFKS